MSSMIISPHIATRRRSQDSNPPGDVVSEREVRSVEPTEVVLANTSCAKCLTCKKDRQKCARKDPNQAKCDRCLALDYVCAIDDLSSPLDGKRRKLQRLKCEACRSAKVKCEPIDRTWPDKCTRCKERNFPCSEPQVSNKKKLQADGRTAATPRSVDSSDESVIDLPITIRSRAQAEPKRAARISAPDAGHKVHGGRRSLSDVVGDIFPPRSDYVYPPLKDDEIRLLIVHKGVPGQEIKCFLVVERLQESRPYQALSYLWSSDVPSNPIKILSFKSGSRPKTASFPKLTHSKIYTRSNLFDALNQLRHPTDDVTLWVNALCINHDDPTEKYPQASRTREIFHRASDVIVWLGKETATSKMGFGFIRKVLDLNDFDKLVKDESNSQSWLALAELMRNPLFSRRWVIQELAVARTAALHCGPQSIPWTDFSDAVALFETNLQKIQRFFKFSLASGGPIDDIRALGASTLVSVVSNIVRKTPDGKTLNRLETLETLVSTLSVFEATDPIDTIIAVMGLAKDHAQLQSVQSTIDSNSGVLDVYIAFVAYCAQSSGSIDIICRHWAPIMKEKTPSNLELITGTVSTKIHLPSWIPDVSGSAFGAPEDKDNQLQLGRANGDSFVGLPDHRIYNAAFGLPPLNLAFGAHAADHHPGTNVINRHPRYDGTLSVQGYSMDVIAELGPRATQGFIFQECLEMGGWTSGSFVVPERLWRTLVADRGPNNTNPPSWYHRACLHCLRQSGTNGDINTTALLNQPRCSQIVADFLRRVQSVIWNRRFLLSKANIDGDRLFGLAPAAAKVGDQICLVLGCSVPVVLREHRVQDDHYFEVVGESFVYGMMDGEVREQLQALAPEEVEAKMVTFKLR